MFLCAGFLLVLCRCGFVLVFSFGDFFGFFSSINQKIIFLYQGFSYISKLHI